MARETVSMAFSGKEETSQLWRQGIVHAESGQSLFTPRYS
jgi:hypothetical protein